MKTRMKKRISISTISVLALVLMLVLGTVLVDHDVVSAKKPAPSLTGTTEYAFAGHLGEFDPEGRLLVWRGTISGDIEGVILWWMVVPFKEVGQTTHFVARWEIWNLDETFLLLAGDEAGTTTVRHYKNSIWRANGTVTEAFGDFEDWMGYQIHDGGNVDWGVSPPVSAFGEGIFRIN
jgi:hypothetical protein